MTFQQEYFKISNIVKEEIEQVKVTLTDGIELQEPLKSKLFNLLNAPSKYIRPLVSFLYLRAAGANIDSNQILYQSAIELVHNASLIHDDIIDESLSRRNVSTLNNEFGNKLAVISGDYLLSVALERVFKLGNSILVKMFADTLNVMSQGEISQQFNKFQLASLDDYIVKSQQKTAKLFETALCGSLIIANSNYNGIQFARNFGIAFQIRDDLINCKTSKSDIKEGIYTAPVIFSDGVNITKDAIEKTQILLNNYIEKAKNELSNLKDSEYKFALTELLELLKYE